MTNVEKLCAELEGEIDLRWPSGTQVKSTRMEGALWRLIGSKLRKAIEADRADMPGEGYEERFAVLHRQRDMLDLMPSQQAADDASGYGGESVRVFVPVRPNPEMGA